MRWQAATSLCLLGLACSSEPHRPAVQAQNSLLSSAPQSADYQSPASFRYHPIKQAPVQAERRLSDGRVLLAGKRG